MIKTVWICLRFREDTHFEINGIFSTKAKAIARCKDWRDSVGPFELDHEESEESLPMENQYYPITK